MARMKRLQISIEPELDAELGRAAAAQGVSKAELVRRFVRRGVEPLPPIDEDPLFKLAGTFEGGLPPGETIDEVLYGPRLT